MFNRPGLGQRMQWSDGSGDTALAGQLLAEPGESKRVGKCMVSIEEIT